MMLSWNIFVKPVMYVLELIFGAVVTFGTADKLLSLSNRQLNCALNDSLGACISIIIIGCLALLLLTVTLWRRLLSAFDDRELFTHFEEAQMCATGAVLWLVVASVVTAKTSFDEGLLGEKIVTLTFAWLLFTLCSLSASVAWLVPERDGELAAPTASEAGIRISRRPSTASLGTATASIATSGISDSIMPVISEPIKPAIGGKPPVQPTLQIPTSAPPPHTEAQIMISQAPALVRSNAARAGPSNLTDTIAINSRWSAWERVIDGPPPRDIHADALGAATRVPISVMLPTPVTSSSALPSPGTSMQGLRRRMPNLPRPDNDEDEITPVE